MITILSGLEDLLESGRIKHRTMVRFDLDGGSQGIWAHSYPLVHGGITYHPAAVLLGEIGARSGLSSEQVEVTVSYLAPQVAAIMSGIAWHQRPVVISKVFLGDADEVLAILPRFAGFLDAARIVDEAEGYATMTLAVESNNRELSRSSNRVRSDADQRLVSSTDGIFKHVTATAVDTNIYWGRRGPQSPSKA